MFDIGFLELVVILVLALLVLGPERLPRAARSIGYWFGKARRYVEGMKSQVEAEFDTSEVKRLLHNQEVQIKELQSQLQNSSDKLEAQITPHFDDNDPGNGHREMATDESEEDHADYDGPRYEIIEEDEAPAQARPVDAEKENETPPVDRAQ